MALSESRSGPRPQRDESSKLRGNTTSARRVDVDSNQDEGRLNAIANVVSKCYYVRIHTMDHSTLPRYSSLSTSCSASGSCSPSSHGTAQLVVGSSPDPKFWMVDGLDCSSLHVVNARYIVDDELASRRIERCIAVLERRSISRQGPRQDFRVDVQGTEQDRSIPETSTYP